MRVKRFAAVALAGVMGMSMLAGCGDSGKDESTTAAAKSDASEATDATEAASEEEAIKTTLTVWGPAEDQSPGYRQHVRHSRKSIQTGISHLSMVHVVRVMLERL